MIFFMNLLFGVSYCGVLGNCNDICVYLCGYVCERERDREREICFFL